MTPYAFTGHPLATALFNVTALVWAVSEIRQGVKRRAEATTRDHASRFIIVVTAAAAAGLAALARSKVTSAGFPSDAVTFGIGLAVIWGGVGLRWWSFWTLGRYFTIDVMTSPDQPVITTGPYRFVRHPSYAALLLVIAGLGSMYANWLSLAVVIVLPLLALMNRMRVEEAVLSATLGDAYRSYAAGHKRIIPFLW
jgi:protein-S-isoprenylcysteine O-methyltransferase Ste14